MRIEYIFEIINIKKHIKSIKKLIYKLIYKNARINEREHDYAYSSYGPIM